jgi:hypothetical protein
MQLLFPTFHPPEKWPRYPSGRRSYGEESSPVGGGGGDGKYLRTWLCNVSHCK